MASLSKQLADRSRRRKVERWINRAAALNAPLTADSADEKLLRLANWAAGDRRAQAMLELCDWQTAADCPADATALLLGLLIQQGEHDEARVIIESMSQQDAASDTQLVRYRIALATKSRDPQVSRLIESLHRNHGHEPSVMRWLQMFQVAANDQPSSISESTINQLAGELLEHLEAIPSLVAAQKLSPDVQTISMLRGAMVQMERDVDEDRTMLTLCQALADLAMLANDGEDARRWAHRGLHIDPYAAPLAIILSKVQDDPAIGPPASSILKAAVNAHPKYPDLRAALIRREASEGRVEVAKRRLHQWLQREPNQSMALRLQQELSANAA